MGSMSVPTYLLVDGENIDATLGMSVLGRRPEPEERPRWDRVLAYCDELSSADATEGEGRTVYDLESDVKAFTIPLPRVCIIPLEDFNPLAFL